MATFLPNPNYETEPWIERPAIEGANFRIWHVIFFCFAGCLAITILICCCVKIRVPRTKQEIEADYQRKKITHKFKERLTHIQNQDMDALDLKSALEIIQEDFKKETRNIEDQMNVQLYPDYNLSGSITKTLCGEPQPPPKGLGKLVALMRIVKNTTNTTTNNPHFDGTADAAGGNNQTEH